MQIDLPPSEQQRLAEHARAAGYADVASFVAEHLSALAHQPTPTEFPPASDTEMNASLAMCDQGMAEGAAGEGRDMREAMDDIADRLGLKIDP